MYNTGMDCDHNKSDKILTSANISKELITILAIFFQIKLFTIPGSFSIGNDHEAF